MSTRHTAEYRKLSRRPASVWRELIVALPNQAVRIKVAGIVWWDWLAERRGPIDSEFGPMLLELCLGGDKGATDADVRNALLAMGYSPEKAERRSRTPNGDNDYARLTRMVDFAKRVLEDEISGARYGINRLDQLEREETK